MNAKQANSIALSMLLDKLGFRPVREKGHESWYLSPLRQEKKASFHVNSQINRWYDFGADKGGNLVDFVCAYLESCGESNTVIDALRYVRNMFPTNKNVVHSARESFTEATSQLSLKDVLPLQNKHLIKYLSDRGIPKALAKKYLKEVHLFNQLTGKKFFALGFRNEEKGFELRNPAFKGCHGTKTVTFIRGAQPITKNIYLFEGFFDFLSALLLFKKEKFDEDCLIINSTSCLQQAFGYIDSYGYRKLYSWMDNDFAGKKATLRIDAFASMQDSLKHIPMNKHYAEHKDVNEWHMHKLKLAKPK